MICGLNSALSAYVISIAYVVSIVGDTIDDNIDTLDDTNVSFHRIDSFAAHGNISPWFATVTNPYFGTNVQLNAQGRMDIQSVQKTKSVYLGTKYYVDITATSF